MGTCCWLSDSRFFFIIRILTSCHGPANRHLTLAEWPDSRRFFAAAKKATKRRPVKLKKRSEGRIQKIFEINIVLVEVSGKKMKHVSKIKKYKYRNKMEQSITKLCSITVQSRWILTPHGENQPSKLDLCYGPCLSDTWATDLATSQDMKIGDGVSRKMSNIWWYLLELLTFVSVSNRFYTGSFQGAMSTRS